MTMSRTMGNGNILLFLDISLITKDLIICCHFGTQMFYSQLKNLKKTLIFHYNILESVVAAWRPTFLILYIRNAAVIACQHAHQLYVLFLFLKSFQHGCLFKHILENYGFTNIADDYLWWNLVGTCSALCGKMSVFKKKITIWTF